VTAVEVIAPGNRRGVGAVNHCMHGKNASIEELLDWRPYDYLTLRNTVPTPVGPVSFLQTTELEPTPDGTILHLRISAPGTLKERTVLRLMRGMLDKGIRAANAALLEQFEAEIAQRGLDVVEEPALPRPRPDGVLAPDSPPTPDGVVP
jgi:hypothetical protein